MKVVSEFEENYTLPHMVDAQNWYKQALTIMEENIGQWVEVDRTTEFNRSQLHKEKFDLLNRGSLYDYETEYRYPEQGTCVMYARMYPKPLHTTERIKRWFK